jgi:hypothetical protein
MWRRNKGKRGRNKATVRTYPDWMKAWRTSTAVIVGLALTGLFGVAHPAWGQASPGVEQQAVRSAFPQEPAIPASLQEIYRRMAVYWEDQNARAIAQLAGGGRVYLVHQRRGVGERLAASQLQYLLQEMFDEGQEVTFRFPEYTAYDPRAGSAYAVGERVWQGEQASEPSVERVFVGARSDRGRWVLTEIRLTLE